MFLETVFDELCVHKLAHKRSSNNFQLSGDDLLFHEEAYNLGYLFLEPGLPHKRVHDALSVPAFQILLGGANKERYVSGFGGLTLRGGEFIQYLVRVPLFELSDARALVSVPSVCERGLCVAGLNEDLLDHILDILDGG